MNLKHTMSPFAMLLLLCVVLGGCAATPADPASRIEGSWSSSVGGFSYVTRFAAGEVMVEGHAAMPYQLDGNRLTVAGDSVMTRIVSFPTTDTMEQLDPVTNTVHRYQRVN